MTKASEIMSRLDAVDVDEMLNGKASYAFLTLDELVDAILGDEERGCASFQQTFRDVREALREAFAELEARAMPEGFEWPRYEGGGLVQFGDIIGMQIGLWMGHPADEMVFRADGSVEVFGDGNSVVFERGEKAIRIVLAADGEPLEPGQTVYATRYGYAKCTVLAIEWVVDGYLVEVENEDGHKFRQTPDEFTHQRPVLDADGVPIHEGDTVYLLPGEWCGKLPLLHYSAGDEMVVKDLCPYHDFEGVLKCAGDGKCNCYPQPEQLTHAKPEADSWERIEADCEMKSDDYARERMGMDLSIPARKSRKVDMMRDLVRRARALAERERGE